MPKFLNTNHHRAYVNDPDGDPYLNRIQSFEEVEATGAYADALSKTPGIYPSNSDEAKAALKAREEEAVSLRSPGPDAFPPGPPPTVEGGGTLTSDKTPTKGSPRKRSAKKD